MSIATEISRLQTDRNTIRAKLVELGLAPNTAGLSTLAAAIEDIINRGAVSATVQEGDTYTIPKGWHNGSGTVSGVAGGGNYSLQSKTVTPTKKQQDVTPDSGYYGLSGVTVAAIPEAYHDVSSTTLTTPEALTGKIFVLADGTVATGSMPNNGAVNKALSVTVISYTIPKGFHDGNGKVTITLEEKTVTPTKAKQEITPTTGKVLSKVTVDPIPDEYQNVSGVTATAPSVLAGDVFVDAEGNAVEGTMPNNQAVSKTLDINTTEYIIPEGYHNGEGKINISPVYGNITPTKTLQTVTASPGTVYAQVAVLPIPDKYQDVTGVTATAPNVLEGDIFVDAEGNPVEGTMPNNGAVGLTMDGLTVTSVAIPTGFHNGNGTVSLTSDIEEALAAI